MLRTTPSPAATEALAGHPTHERASARAGRRPEAVALALGVAGLFALYVWAGQYWIDLADEGYFLYLASRVAQGDLPYRDFETYYTPGVFYLYAALFKLFGVSVVPVRVLLAGVRVACALLLYGLTRRVAPWPFALLPFLAIALVDPMPIFPEPHPAWMGLLATLLTLELLVRWGADERPVWLVGAGAAAGLAYLFKQNVGAFAALAVGGYVVFRPRERAGRLLFGARALFAALVGLVVTLFLRPGLDPLLAATLWLPTLATLAMLVGRSRGARSGSRSDGLAAAVREGTLAGAAFVTVTLLWLVPLVFALGPAETPWGLFVGAVNQEALILPLEPPPRAARELALIAIWLPIALAGGPKTDDRGPTTDDRPGRAPRPSTRARGPRSLVLGPSSVLGPRSVFAALAVSLLVLLMPTQSGPRALLAEDPSLYPWLSLLDEQLGTLYLYLPALGAWGGLLALTRARRSALSARSERDAAPLAPRPSELVIWYLLVGTFAQLAMYPRVDTLHTMFAGPPLFVVGAWALSRAWSALAGQAGAPVRAAVFGALLVIPTAAVAPHAYWRYVSIVHADPRSPVPLPYVPLGLERAPVVVPPHVAAGVRGAVDFLQAGTPPGEPLFVYPVAPLFNFLADRPNPTRFDHFLPGALTPDDMAQVIDRLETARPRYVLWDHGGVVYWLTEEANRPLSDYIWRCYAQAANFPPYLILERRPC